MEQFFKIARTINEYKNSYVILFMYYLMGYVVLVRQEVISIYTIPIPIGTLIIILPLFLLKDIEKTINLTTFPFTQELIKNVSIGTFFSTFLKKNNAIHDIPTNKKKV